MNIVPILFEDHTFAQFRPVSWSMPLYEIRVGVFNLRERISHLRLDSSQPGCLLGRSFLDGLQQDVAWVNGFVNTTEYLEDSDSSTIWINGRLGWTHAQLKGLLDQAQKGQDIHLADEHGPLVFTCSPGKSQSYLADWGRWYREIDALGCLGTPETPLPEWTPEIETQPQPTETLKWIWDIVPSTSRALQGDLAFVKKGFSWMRKPFGICAVESPEKPIWELPTSLKSLPNNPRIFVAPEVAVDSSCAFDTSQGPIILDRGVSIMPHSYLAGPLYIGPGSTVKAGATIYGESSFGIVNKIAGEIGESTFGDFSNKQHDGFIGHAVLGAWVNLGAMTTCSDLKNNYGPVRVDLGRGAVDSGRRFVGLLMGDHTKTAIGTLFNTGTAVGFASNIFGGIMPPKFVPNFSWGGHQDSPEYSEDKALETAEIVMGRRACVMKDGHRELFKVLSPSS